jgi:DNA-binding NarL/FixJ family response regulator
MMSGEVKIMIGDSDVFHLQKLLNILFEAGFHNTLCVTNYEEIQNYLAIETPELIIIDWQFELPNCIQIINCILEQYSTTPPAVIILSKNKLINGEVQSIISCGIDDCIYLNGNDNDFLTRLKMGLHRKRMRDAILSELSTLREQLNTESKKELKNHNTVLQHSNDKLQHELTCMQLKLLQNTEFLNKMLCSFKQHRIDNQSSNKKCQKRILDWIHQINFVQNSNIWKELKQRIDSVYSGFYCRLLKDYPALTEVDLRLISLIKLYLTTKEIAAISNQSINTIKAARKRVRHKLKIQDKSITLLHFLADYQ